jgi:hypothetical protein
MEIRKDFVKYWIAGIIFAFIAGAIQQATSYLGVVAKLSVQSAVPFYFLIGIWEY